MVHDLAFDSKGEGRPIVILHGLFGSSSNWHLIARRLCATRRVVSVDLRNHGASPWGDSMSYIDMAKDVRRLVSSQGLSRPDIIGHSVGGKVAMTLALLYPESIRRLAVVDIAPVTYADRLSFIGEAMRSIDTKHMADREAVRRRLADAIPNAGVAAFLMQNLITRDGRLEWRLNLDAILAAMPDLCSFPRELCDLRFEGPMRVIKGGKSDYVMRKDGAAFRPMFPQVQVEVIDAAGHWVHTERPDEFTSALKRTLHE